MNRSLKSAWATHWAAQPLSNAYEPAELAFYVGAQAMLDILRNMAKSGIGLDRALAEIAEIESEIKEIV